ncbi:hypothetical protein LEN26_000072 [Aphanomyces euteiches]|nr:hypothetical protein LEN26_000072 [Aphanomyces euteiches]
MPIPSIDAFHCPPLLAQTQSNIIAEAKAACHGLVANALRAETTPVEAVVSRTTTGLLAKIFSISDSVDPSRAGAVAHIRIQATLQQVADFFHMEASTQTYARIMEDNTIASGTLYSLIERPIADGAVRPLHSISIEWFLRRLGVGIPLRDLTCIDIQDEFVLDDVAAGRRRRGWARCLHSVDLPTCPSLEKTHNVIRMKVCRSGHVFLESNTPGVLDYYHVHIGTPKGTLLGRHFRQWYRRAMVKTLAHSVMNLAEHFVMQRIRPSLDVSVVAQFQARRGVHYCTNCLVRFAWLSSKKQCRCCGRVLCHKCVRLWTWYNKSAVQVPLCPNCVGTTPPSPHQSALAVPQPIPVARDTSTGWSTLPGSMLANCSPLQPPTPQRFSSGLVINGLDATRPENRWERGNASTMSLDLRPSFGNESSLVSAASAPSSSQNQVAFNP